MKTLLLLLGISVTYISLNGCSAPVTKTGMTPTQVVSYKSTGKTVTVLPVTIRQQPSHSALDTIHTMPDAALYREAIISSLNLSGLFSEVKTSGDSDYTLSSDVIGERLQGGLNNIGLFLIRYELSDVTSNKVIWRENIFSHSMLSAEDVFAGAERAPKVIEIGIKNNLTTLTERLGEVLPK
jgi:hypothetical protein